LFSELLSLDDLGDDLFARSTFPAHRFYGDLEGREGHSLGAEVAENPDASPPLIEHLLLDERRCPLRDRVDHVGAHRILHVDKQLYYDASLAELSVPEPFDPSSSCDHRLAGQVGMLDDPLPVYLQLELRICQILDIEDLDLGNHHRWG